LTAVQEWFLRGQQAKWIKLLAWNLSSRTNDHFYCHRSVAFVNAGPTPGSFVFFACFVASLLRAAQRQCRRRPAAGGDRDELMVAVRETTFVIGLERPAARFHQPGAVFELRLQQKLDAALICLIVDRQAAGLMEGYEG